MSSRPYPFLARLFPAFSLLIVATSMVAFNGGISIGTSNHVGLLPVVRRIINEDYLPGDFNIELRLYHHRVFAEILAFLSKVFGEDAAVVTLHIVSVLALSAALLYLSRVLTLPAWGYLLFGFLLSVNGLWIGLGIEENNFVGNAEVQPPTLAHAFVLAGTAAIIQKRWRLCALFAGLAALFHLQIGFIFTLMIAPFFVKQLRRFSLSEILTMGLAYIIPAVPAIWNAQRLLARGVSNSAFTIDYLRFRMPHHYEISSPGAGVWFLVHLVFIALALLWFRRRTQPESNALEVLLALSLVLTFLVVLHTIDYQWLHFMTTLKFQFPRLSSLVTVFGGLTLILWLSRWQPERRWLRQLAVGMLVLAGGLAFWNLGRNDPARISLAVHKYSEQKSAWVDMCLWVKASGTRDVVYLTPPGRAGFTCLTDRSNVVEFKINPDGGQFLPEWIERLQDLCGGALPTGRGLENRRPIDRAFAALSADQLRRLATKYNALLAVLPQSSQAEFPVLYSNEEFRIVQIAAY